MKVNVKRLKKKKKKKKKKKILILFCQLTFYIEFKNNICNLNFIILQNIFINILFFIVLFYNFFLICNINIL